MENAILRTRFIRGLRTDDSDVVTGGIRNIPACKHNSMLWGMLIPDREINLC